RRIAVDDLVAMQVSIEASNRGEIARHRALAETALREVPEKTAHRDAVDLVPFPRCAAEVAAEIRDELREVARVREHSVGRDVALFREVVEIVRDFGKKWRDRFAVVVALSRHASRRPPSS